MKANDIVSGGHVASMRQWEGSGNGESLALHDAVVIQVARGKHTVLAGLNPSDGTTMWQQPVADWGTSCWAVLDDTALMCVDDAKNTLDLMDPATGKTRGAIPFPMAEMNVYSTRNQIYVASEASDGTAPGHDVKLTAYSADGLSQVWSSVLPNLIRTGPNDVDIFDGGIGLNSQPPGIGVGYGMMTWVVDPTTGHILTQADPSTVNAGEEDAGEGYLTTWDNTTDVSRLRVLDPDGNTMLLKPGDPWLSPSGTYVKNGKIGIGPSLYDLATGKTVWTRADLYVLDEYGIAPTWNWSADGQWVFASDPTDANGDVPGTTLLDADTGQTVWHADTAVDQWNSVSTSDAIATVSNAQVTVRPFAAADPAWNATVTDIADAGGDTYFTIGTTGTSLVVSASKGVVGFTGFGAAPGGPGDDGTLEAGGTPGSATSGDSSGDSSGDGGTDYVTECGSEPTFTPVESEAANGGLTVTFTVTAVCPSGQWLSSDGQQIVVSSTSGSGQQQTYAAGAFDFSQDPVWVPGPDDDPITMTVVYPYSNAFATPDEVNAAITNKVIVVDCVKEPGASDGAVPSDPEYGADPATPVVPVRQGLDPEQVDEYALDALRRLAAADNDDVEASLDGHWMPQLSSKIRGTRDDGISYTYEDILAEHLRLRSRYPDVRLVQSSEWKSFLLPNYWVTLVGGEVADRPAAPLRWCAVQGFDRDHCYAKRLLRDGPSDGSTRNR